MWLQVRLCRWMVAGATLCAAQSVSSPARAEPPTAPFAVQAQILARILPYDRGFTSKAKREVRVVLVEKAGDAESGNAVQQMHKALADIGQIRDLPLRIESVTYTGAAALAAACRAQGAHVVYVSPGLSDETSEVGKALLGSGILSFAAVEPYVPKGIVVGVAVSAGKPRMSINLAQARAQNIDYPAAVLKLAKVY